MAFELHFPKKSSHCSPTLTLFYPPPPPPLNKLPLHSFTNLPPLAAQLLRHFTPSISHCFSPHIWRLLVLNPQPLYPQLVLLILQTINACPTPYGRYIWIKFVRIAPSQQITPSLLHHFTPSNLITTQTLTPFYPIGSPALSSSYPLWTKNPNSYTALPTLAAQILPHFAPSEQTARSLVHHFTPLGSSTLYSFYSLWTNYPLTLTPFNTPWQLNSKIVLPPLNKLPLHSYTILHFLPIAGHCSPLLQGKYIQGR